MLTIVLNLITQQASDLVLVWQRARGQPFLPLRVSLMDQSIKGLERALGKLLNEETSPRLTGKTALADRAFRRIH